MYFWSWGKGKDCAAVSNRWEQKRQEELPMSTWEIAFGRDHFSMTGATSKNMQSYA